MIGRVVFALSLASSGSALAADARPPVDATESADTAAFEISDRVRGSAPAGWRPSEAPAEMLAELERQGYLAPLAIFAAPDECGFMLVLELSQGGSLVELLSDFSPSTGIPNAAIKRSELQTSGAQPFVRAEANIEAEEAEEAEEVEVEMLAAAYPHPVQVKLLLFIMGAGCPHEGIDEAMRSVRVIDPRVPAPARVTVRAKPRKTIWEELGGLLRVVLVVFFVGGLSVLWKHRRRR